MAGYIFTVSKDGWRSFCSEDLNKGFFTPFTLPVTAEDATPHKRKARNRILAATFADLVTMQTGDNVYFLSDRKIYGIGTTVQIGPDCKLDNYDGASALLPNYQISPDDYLTTKDTRARWVCFFKPAPFFFKKGADMDDVLRYRPSAFKSLRAFEGLSFLKIDDEENRALKEYISLINEAAYDNIPDSTFPFTESCHQQILTLDLSGRALDLRKALQDPENRPYVESEMFIEGLLLQSISMKHSASLGDWDYLSHQLIASPFKPLQYIDRIDVFGYRFSNHYSDQPRLITKYLLVELKKDRVNRAALEQTMQYVDWICSEYAAGDYSKIEAYVIGDSAVRNVNSIIADVCQRSFIRETHPVVAEKWSNLRFVKYTLDDDIAFDVVEP